MCLITAPISLGVIIFLDYLIPPNSVLEDCMFLRTYPFHPDCPIYWHIVVHNIFLQFSVFLWSQLLLILFHLLFYLFNSSFFLDESG